MPWHALRRSAVCTHHRWGHVSCSLEYFNCLFRGIWYSLYQKQWVPRVKAAALEQKEGPGLGIWILFFVLAGGFSSSRYIWTYLRRSVAVMVTVCPSSPHFPLRNGGGGEQVESLFASGLLLPGAFSFLSVQDVMIRERGPELGGLRDHPSLRFTKCLWRFKWVFQGLCKHCFRCCQLFWKLW